MFEKTTREIALEYVDNGLRVIPITLDGEKRPNLPMWESLHNPTTSYTHEMVSNWFPEGRHSGLGLVLGETAGGMICFDMEYDDFADQLMAYLDNCMPELKGKIPIVRSPGKTTGGGRHLYLRCPGYLVKDKNLARITDKEAVERTGNAKNTLAIELRFQGHQMLIPGGDARQHPTGKPYEHLNGTPAIWDAPKISFEDLDAIISVCRGLSHVEIQKSTSRFDSDSERAKKTESREPGSKLPGCDFNERGPKINEILAGHFSYVYTKGDVDYFRRSGKEKGISASWGYAKSQSGLPLFYCWSSNASPFDPGRTYDAYGAWALINHGGSFSKASSALYKLGYGDRLKPKVISEAGPPPEAEEGKEGGHEKEDEDEKVNNFYDSVYDFPVQVFPPRIVDYCNEVSSAKDSPIDFCAVMVLCVASSAIGAVRKIVWKADHIEMASMYVALVGGASSGKSPTFGEVMGPLVAEAKELERQNQVEEEQYEDEKEEVENGGKGKGVKLRKPPVPKEIHVEDFTIESLIPLLAVNPRGLAVPQDELTSWLEAMNKYSGKGTNTDRSFYLSAWNGKPYKKNRRVSSEKILTGDVFLSIYGGIQPSRVAAITGGQITGDGFADRFLFCYPERTTLKPYNFDKTVGANARMIWSDIYSELRKLEYDQAVDRNGNRFDVAKEVRLSQKARDIFSEWDLEHIREVNENLVSPHLISVWGKFRAHFPRLTLILHYLRFVNQIETNEFEVSGDTAEKVVLLVEYFKSHAKKTYATFPETKADQDVMDLLHWMRRQKPERREIGWSARILLNCRKVKKATEGEKMLDDLVDRGAGYYDQSGNVFKLYK